MPEHRSRPTGTVTFLFTDIEGSTRLWETVPEAMTRSLARHDAILGALIEANAGYVFKTVGDAFCASFARPAEAVKTAVEIAKALALEDWGEAPIKVRIGLHTGEAEERGGDYFGPPVNRVARIMAAGAGGQILLSAATAALARGSLPPGIVLVSLGQHRLKDLTDPEEIHQLQCPGLPQDFPPLGDLDRYRHNLPVQLTSFIGREREIAELVDRLPRNRLVTLTGPGGCGKTRLALQAASELVDSFPEGAWFLDLAPMTDPFLIPLELAAILGIREKAAAVLPDRIAESIGRRAVLLVIDNCEHLVAACATLVGGLLRSCPGLRVLATSREALGIGGEIIFPVEPFGAPELGPGASLETLAANDCVRLFAERATGALPSFRLGLNNALAVARICARLDGIPLAIELAAARARVLSPDQILARLDDRFRLLTGGDRGAQRRQQTLRDLIEWSYDLLAEEERRLFRALSVFASGWDLEAAEKVCGGDGGDGCLDILDLLEELVVKSLVVAEEGAGGARFRMLESIREYARAKLVEAAEDERLEDILARFFAERALRLSAEVRGPGQAAAIAAARPDDGNFLAALDALIARGEAAEALGLAVSLEWFHYRIGRFGESRRALESALAAAEAAGADGLTRLKGAANVSLAWICFAQGDLEAALERYSLGLRECRAVGDAATEARALTGLGVTVRWMGDRARGLAFSAEGMEAARRSGSPAAIVQATIWACATLDGFFDGEPPLDSLEEGLALARRLGDHWSVAHLLDGIADLHRVQGRHVQARASYAESLKIFREQGDRFLEAFVLDGMAKNELADRRPAEARELFIESLKLTTVLGPRYSAADALAWIATASSQLGDDRRAARLFAASEALFLPGEREHLLRRHADMIAALAKAELSAPEELRAGREMDFEAVLRFAFGPDPA